MADNLPAVAQEIAAIETAMRTDRTAYMRDSDLQDRYRSLLDRHAGGDRAPAAPTGTSAERTRLEALMRDRRSEYWTGPQAERNQARYLELLREGEGKVPAKADARPAGAVSQ